jgi:hypothetical protein
MAETITRYTSKGYYTIIQNIQHIKCPYIKSERNINQFLTENMYMYLQAVT